LKIAHALAFSQKYLFCLDVARKVSRKGAKAQLPVLCFKGRKGVA